LFAEREVGAKDRLLTFITGAVFLRLLFILPSKQRFMKKIGILHGQENTFPQAFVDRVNKIAPKGIVAEPAHVDEVIQAKSSGYAVLIDRISQDVPFYRAWLKNAALMGTAVINNPFWWSADEKFFNNCLTETLNIPVPKTVLLPSRDMPDDTTGNSFRNLKFPLDWEDFRFS
jgi:glutathione synthase/RimK-type ligase-like ATP-grasp enzyme